MLMHKNRSLIPCAVFTSKSKLNIFTVHIVALSQTDTLFTVNEFGIISSCTRNVELYTAISSANLIGIAIKDLFINEPLGTHTECTLIPLMRSAHYSSVWS